MRPLCKIKWQFLKILKFELAHDPAIPVVGIYLKEMRILYPGVIYNLIFIAELFAKPRCGNRRCVRKLWCVFIHCEILFSHKKGGNLATCDSIALC